MTDCDACGRYDDDYDTHMYCVDMHQFDRVDHALERAEVERDRALQELRELQEEYNAVKGELEKVRWSTIVRRDSW
jgi:uncharacterized protein (DUF3084 family)